MTSDVAERLAVRLKVFSEGLTPGEKYNFHLMLSAGASGLGRDNHPPDTGVRLSAWKAALSTLATISTAGVVRIKDTRFIVREYLESLLSEAETLPTERIGPSEHALGGGVAMRLGADSRLHERVAEGVGHAVQLADSFHYHHYNLPGDHLDPHVDPESSSDINCLISIVHRSPEAVGRRSALVVYGSDGTPERIDLEPGDAVLLRGSGTLHGREPTSPGEVVINLSIGFWPA